ncbi:P-loop containing nucleoside triphosphate hydrolase protein [Sporormia fimetaria CBS 119925]|uniref:P-loop containing nucleoside triphosphate hydrolase protein n=1 Tax=Sporormia fimetaria CBS 119925 TaxID=1340428 RepID=A0A6A6V943_9PLEO|nr:P-loop containing nucleoside triphosphate hydrolase protein [Sporormia fimetaria CBS 119925]
MAPLAIPMATIQPSVEQQATVNLCLTENVVVTARPGAGKTATAQAIVAANHNRPIAILTYSKRLQLQTAERLEQYPWSDEFTFHGLAGRLFNTVVSRDSALRSLRNDGIPPVWTGKPYEIIVLDELQDCTDDLFWLTCTFITAVTHALSGRAPQIVVLGDERQAIYKFRGADSRYLSLAPSTMATLSPYPWTHLTMSKSFRLSHENSTFVNNVFLNGEQYITGSHSGPKPLYLHGPVFQVESLAAQLLPLIQKYGPEQTAILSPAVRTNYPLSELTNLLPKKPNNIPIAVSTSDEAPLDDAVLQGKLCVSTYHQFKGSERDLVIGRDLADNTCPNETFVALTRACKQLVLVHDQQQFPMPFSDVEELHKLSDFVDLSDSGMKTPKSPGRPPELGLALPKKVFASDVTRHVPDDIIEEMCAKHLHISKAPPLPATQPINAPDKVLANDSKQHYEAVSDLNGLAVVAAYEHAQRGTLKTLGKKEPPPKSTSRPRKLAIWLCHEACNYEVNVSNYRSRQIQMEDHPFDWLTRHLEAAKNRLKAQFPETDNLEFEVALEKRLQLEDPAGGKEQETDLRGRVDIVQTGLSKSRTKIATIWEIKFVSQLSLEHVIQASIYGYLWSDKFRKRKVLPRIILFNVRDGEKWEITPRDGVASLRAVEEEILIAKYTKKDTLTDDEFLDRCARTKAEVENAFARA